LLESNRSLKPLVSSIHLKNNGGNKEHQEPPIARAVGGFFF